MSAQLATKKRGSSSGVEEEEDVGNIMKKNCSVNVQKKKLFVRLSIKTINKNCEVKIRKNWTVAK